MNDQSLKNESDIDFDKTYEFFEFFESHGVEYFFLDALPRLANGERGAPVAKYYGIQRAIGGAPGMIRYVKQLQNSLKRDGKIADLHIKESPGGKGEQKYHRVLLVDDLELHFLEKLASDYPGPIAGIETSPGNYQALLISPRSPRGLFASEVLQIQKSLAIDYCGDGGAVAAGQFHRFAGSPNYKNCANGASPFFTRITFLRGHDSSKDCTTEEFLNRAMRSRPASPLPTRRPAHAELREEKRSTGHGRDETESGEAFRHAMRLLRRGMPGELVTVELSSRWGSGRSPDWSKRTCWNAQRALGMREERYTSGTNH